VRRFFVPGPLEAGASIEIVGDLHVRLARVLRLGAGAEIVLFDGSGGEWPARIEEMSRQSATVCLGKPSYPSREPLRRVVLYQALIRPALFELVLEKGTELGVHAFVPIVSERSARGSEVSAARTERWQRIVVEAAEQSGRLCVPGVHAPLDLADALASAPGRRILAWERSGEATPLGSLAEGEEFSLFIGPEGGFTEPEVDQARRLGAELAGLGKLVLRSETAAIAACAVLLTRP
jgi:16S rRNA (uracil1498-N3)-methyltransferase